MSNPRTIVTKELIVLLKPPFNIKMLNFVSLSPTILAPNFFNASTSLSSGLNPENFIK